MKDNKWIEWIVELQSLAQIGLTYGKDAYDKERYEKIREISAEMMANISDIPIKKVKDLFCNESGYQTPKIDTRAAVFKNGKILLVHENNDKWSLPGGWCDVNLSVAENTIKEVREESGLYVLPNKIIAILDRSKHNLPLYAYGVCKIFIECNEIGGEFKQNLETVGYSYFSEDNLPELATEKNNKDQIKMCFDAYNSNNWKTLFD